jgi:hypothetical protein
VTPNRNTDNPYGGCYCPCDLSVSLLPWQSAIVTRSQTRVQIFCLAWPKWPMQNSSHSKHAASPDLLSGLVKMAHAKFISLNALWLLTKCRPHHKGGLIPKDSYGFLWIPSICGLIWPYIRQSDLLMMSPAKCSS